MSSSVSVLTRRHSPLREATYRLLVTSPSRVWTVADLCGELGGGASVSPWQVREITYLLLADRVLTAVAGNRVLTVALTADGKLILGEILSGWRAGSVMTMDIRVERDIATGVTTATLSGELTIATSNQVRQALTKCVVDCPTAVIVNLKDVRMGSSGLIAVFATAYQHAMREYGVPVLYAEASAELALRLAVFDILVHLFPTEQAAVLSLDDWVPRWWCQNMAPVAASVTAARDMVGEACQRWDLAAVRDPAQRIVAELVTNAITHAGGPFQTTVSHSQMYLRIGVKDPFTTLPRPPDDPRTPPDRAEVLDPPGLRIVQELATHWGSTPMPDGNVVWAVLRT